MSDPTPVNRLVDFCQGKEHEPGSVGAVARFIDSHVRQRPAGIGPSRWPNVCAMKTHALHYGPNVSGAQIDAALAAAWRCHARLLRRSASPPSALWPAPQLGRADVLDPSEATAWFPDLVDANALASDTKVLAGSSVLVGYKDARFWLRNIEVLQEAGVYFGEIRDGADEYANFGRGQSIGFELRHVFEVSAPQPASNP